MPKVLRVQLTANPQHEVRERLLVWGLRSRRCTSCRMSVLADDAPAGAWRARGGVGGSEPLLMRRGASASGATRGRHDWPLDISRHSWSSVGEHV